MGRFGKHLIWLAIALFSVPLPLAANDVDFLDGAILIATSLVGLVLVARPGGIGRIQGIILVATYILYVVTAIV